MNQRNEPGRPTRQRQEPEFHAIAVSSLLHTQVFNAHGELLGSVHELLVHRDSGRIEFVSLLPAEARPQDGCIPVPWSQFEWAHGALKLDISRAALRLVTA